MIIFRDNAPARALYISLAREKLRFSEKRVLSSAGTRDIRVRRRRGAADGEKRSIVIK